MARPDADSDLVLGEVAAKLAFLSRDDLALVIEALDRDGRGTLGEYLVGRGLLRPDDLALLESLADPRLPQPGGLLDASQATVNSKGFELGVPVEETDRATSLPNVNLPSTQADGDSPGRSLESTEIGPADETTDFESTRSFAAETVSLDSTRTQDLGASLGGLARNGGLASEGRFLVIRLHDRGGLGEVFVAHDRELHREVALKRIKDEHADNEQRRTRFVVEAEITGGLEHPGIVPVYSLGQSRDGRPYYAMRFIQGETLRESCERFHRSESPDRDPGERELELRGLLRRFLDVCNAMAYAHSRGVVHRDLKPSNIILGKFGETLVIDWGLAKCVGRPDLAKDGGPLVPGSSSVVQSTQMGARVGTPTFMSPEQAVGQLDQLGPASDVYSLGATLYCILTGQPPFSERSMTDVLRKVERGEFRPPRFVNPRVHPALDAICRKAMALVREDRYSTARALGDDLEHWLADEPVLAYPDPPMARLARWCRRHKPAVAGAAALLLTAVVALSISTVLINRERARKEEQRRLATINLRLAQEAADDMLTEVGDVELAEIPQMEPVRRRLLEKARRKYQVFLGQREDDPATRYGAGVAHARLGDVLEMMGEFPDAERSYRRAIDLLTGLPVEAGSGADPVRELARSSHGLGVLLKKTNRFRESEAAFRAAIRLREPIAAAAPGDPQAGQALADSRYQLATLLARLSGRRAEDEAVYRDVLARQQALVAEQRGRPEYRARLGRYLNNLAMLLSATDQTAEAESAFRDVLSTQADLNRASPELPGPRWQLARGANNLGALLKGLKDRSSEAETLFRYAKTLLDTLSAEFPKVPQYLLELAAVEHNIGLLEQENSGHFKEAEAAFRRARKLLDDLTTEFPGVPEYRQKLAVVLFDLNLLLSRSDPDGAEPLLREAVAAQERLIAAYPEVPDYPRTLGRSLYNLARVLLDRGDRVRARPLLERAILHHQAARAADPEDRTTRAYLCEDRGVLAISWLDDGDPVKAAAAIEDLPGLLPDDFTLYGNTVAILARCATAVLDDARLPKGSRRELERQYGDRAMLLLRQAVARGVIRDVEQLDRSEFEPLRRREDFQKLREQVPSRRTPAIG